MFNEIDFSKIDTSITPPQDEGAGTGTADYLLSADVWVSDE